MSGRRKKIMSKNLTPNQIGESKISGKSEESNNLHMICLLTTFFVLEGNNMIKTGICRELE